MKAMRFSTKLWENHNITEFSVPDNKNSSGMTSTSILCTGTNTVFFVGFKELLQIKKITDRLAACCKQINRITL